MKEKNIKKALLWNMIGSSVYSGSSILYLMVVTRICGVDTAGFFSLCYATAQLLLTVGRFGMRTHQATDLIPVYSFREYGISRWITCLAMLAGGLLYSGLSFRGDRIVIGVFIVMMKMIDAVEDVYHGHLQQIHHVETMGKLLCARNLYSAAAFTVILLVTKSLMLTVVVTVTSSLLLCLLINQTAVSRLDRELAVRTDSLRWGKVLQLLRYCAPLFAGTFLSLFLYNLPKYAMAGVMADEFQTYYSVLFMPSFVITLLCEFIFKPTITSIAEQWMSEDMKAFGRSVAGIVLFILVMDAVIVLGGHLIGRTLLEIIYAVDLAPYKLHFIVLLAGGGIGAEVYMLYNILIAVRRDKWILPVYALTTLLTLLPTGWLVRRFAIMGACLSYFLSCSILCAFFTVILIHEFSRRKRELTASGK